MTARRWPLPTLAALGLGLVPACLYVEKSVPITPPGWKPPPAKMLPVGSPAATDKSDFASLLPRKPGDRVAKNPPPAVADAGPRVEAATPTETRTSLDLVGPVQPAQNVVKVPDPPAEPDAPLTAAVRAFGDGHPERAVEALKGMGKGNQAFVLELLPLLDRVSKIDLDHADPQEVAVLSEQLQAAAARLEPKAALRIDRATFCRKVAGFGRYDPWPDGQAFGPADLAELYVEVRHVTSEPASGAANGEAFVTRLASTLEVRDAAGRLVEQTDPADWQKRVPAARFDRTDFSRTPVRDYFLKYRFPVPPVPGAYTVTVEVRDPAGVRKARSKPVEFRVGP